MKMTNEMFKSVYKKNNIKPFGISFEEKKMPFYSMFHE